MPYRIDAGRPDKIGSPQLLMSSTHPILVPHFAGGCGYSAGMARRRSTVTGSKSRTEGSPSIDLAGRHASPAETANAVRITILTGHGRS